MVLVVPLFLVIAVSIFIFRRLNWRKLVFVLDVLAILIFLIIVAGYIETGILLYSR